MKIIEHYDDKQVIGTWGIAHVNPDGTLYTDEADPSGNMTGHTIKVMDDSGKVSLERVWEAQESWEGLTQDIC